jgi:3-methyladenine DNA glycosylase AlkD
VELLGVVTAARAEEIQALVDNWIPTLESGETADALADYGYAPVVLADPFEHLQRAKKWMLSPNKWARYFSLTSMRPLAKTKTWDDIPTALEILRYAMIDPDAMVRQAAAHLLTDLLVKSPMEIKLFLQEQSARTHPHAHAIVRTVIRALPVEEQTEIIKAMRV